MLEMKERDTLRLDFHYQLSALFLTWSELSPIIQKPIICLLARSVMKCVSER